MSQTFNWRWDMRVNIGLADGSVKFVKDSIAPQTWWAVGSRNQGEIVSADAW